MFVGMLVLVFVATVFLFACKYYMRLMGDIYYKKSIEQKDLKYFLLLLLLSVVCIFVLFNYSEQLGYENVDVSSGYYHQLPPDTPEALLT